jgi:ABC-2 type transport system ATP-binding protein
MNTPPAISVEGLRVTFGRHVVLDGIDLTVEHGEIFALLGPNGAGKTTCINVLTTLVTPESGRVRVAGVDVTQDPATVTRLISLTGQSAAVDDALTGIENLVMFGRLSGLSGRGAKRRAAELLDRFDLTAASTTRVAAYSGGMRRRLDLALSFVVTPRVLFLDEPTTGLDTRSRRELWDVIRALAAAGTTVFLTTQYLEEADHLADRIAVLDGGRIVATGSAAELKARVGGDTVLLHDANGEVIREVPTDGTVSGLRAALDAFDRDAVDGIVSLRRPSLDDVFLSITGTHSRTEDAASPLKESA